MSSNTASDRTRLWTKDMQKKHFADEAYIDTEINLSSRPAAGNEMKYLQQALDSGNLSALMGGKMTPLFEQNFARMLGCKHAVALNTCMSALHSAVIAAGAGAGSEVICDSVYIFGAMAVLYNNAIPVFIDVDETTHNMDPDRIEAAITERTKAIIVTHAWGLPAEMDRIMAVARKHDLMVIEDCAEAVLARYDGKYTGTWGDIGCFSFQASKQMSLGDGGMATMQDDAFYKAVANFALAPTFLSIAHTLDYNYRINELTAAVGLARLETLEKEIGRLLDNAGHFDQAVEGCDWITLQRGPEKAEHSFYYWAGNFIDTDNGPSLDEFTQALTESEAATLSVGYTKMAAYDHPLIKNRAAQAFTDPRNKDFESLYEAGRCPVAERIVPQIILGYTIAPDDTVKRDAEKLHEVIRKLS
ncbi:MAG: DegT/DnrJ/EryC1/StrS family aminotransferase [Pirellulales bacterium]|nr:DegT/DnrJ/EryC1/StrS family aminotransferase [Pirellulales bacterium]